MSCDHYQVETRKCLNPKSAYVGKRVGPSLSICGWCPQFEGPSRGAGDVVHKILHAPGIRNVTNAIAGEGCGGCQKRRNALNDLLNFTKQ